MFVLHQGYRQLNGRLAGREPALLHNSGLSVLTTWAPVLKPTDSPDPRLSELIAEGDQFRLNDIWSRDGQLYSPGDLVDRWKQIEPNAAISNQVAKQTALNALLRRPMGVATLGAKTFLGYWDFNHIRRQAKVELGKALNNWPKKKDMGCGYALSFIAAAHHETPKRTRCCNDTFCVHSHTITLSCYHPSFVSV